MGDAYGYDSFRQARWFHKGRRDDVELVVVHCPVSPEQGNGAESVAKYFATTGRRGSTHAVADSNSVVGCVHDADTAYGAAGANANGLHIELVGMPQQTAAEWLDPFGRAMFERAGAVVRAWGAAYEVPVDRFLTVDELRAGKRGLTDHATVERAFPSTGHWDPGPWFPHAVFLDYVKPTTTPEDDPMYAAILDRIDRLYDRHVGREPDPAGQAHWYDRYVAAQRNPNPEQAKLLSLGVDRDLVATLKNEP